MSGILNEQGGGEELVDYEEDEQQQQQQNQNQLEIKEKIGEEIIIGRGNYVGIHSSGFRDFFLKPELVRAIGDAGFEHPSEVQHETIPHAITGSDILCQAKSGMGKTAVFVLSILQQINIDNNNNLCMVDVDDDDNNNDNNNKKNNNNNNVKNNINNNTNVNNNNNENNENNIENNNNKNNNNDIKNNDVIDNNNLIKNNKINSSNVNSSSNNNKNNNNNSSNNIMSNNNNINNNSKNNKNNNNNINNNNISGGMNDGNTYGIICLGIAHTRELAFQIKNEFDRFSKYIKGIKCEVVYGGVNIQKNINMLKDNRECPHILIGTPGRLLALIKMKVLNVSKIKHFVLDECDKCLEKIDMRKDVQEIFMNTMKKKQVMFFSATMNKEIRAICKKFMQHPIEIFIDNESKLTLHGLLQYYIQLQESEKNRKLNDLLDSLEFNQVIIFVKSVTRAQALDALLTECNFPSFAIHAGLPQEERINRYQQFKNFEKRIMVATDLFGRGIDIERVNIVINYDMPDSSDAYLHRVGRAGRFGTKGLAITFVASQEDTNALNDVQTRFEVHIPQMPATIDTSQYINQ